MKYLIAIAITIFMWSSALAGTRVYFIAGQSNASGMPNSDELTDEEATIPANVTLWANTSGVMGEHVLVTSHYGLPKFGFEVSLIKKMSARYPNDPLVFIKISKGGTSMEHWIAGGTQHAIFFATIPIVLAGVAEPIYRNLFWMQGESDTITEAREDAYEARTVSWLADVRAAYGSSMYIHMGLINPILDDDHVYQYGVCNGQLRIIEQDGYTRGVTTQVLSKFPDGIHYDKAGVLELGRRMFQKAVGN